MALRWTAAGMLEAEQQFRKIVGYHDLATLVIAIERDLTARGHTDTTPPPQGGRYPRSDLTITPGPRRTSTTSGTSSGLVALAVLSAFYGLAGG
jgi:hypothetical protein